jgi:hypothetical protein
MFLKRKKDHDFLNEDAFMSFHFWLTNEEIAQLEEIARQHQTQPAAVVQSIVKHALRQLREQDASMSK